MCTTTALMTVLTIGQFVNSIQQQQAAQSEAVAQQKHMNINFLAQAEAVKAAAQGDIDALTAQQQEINEAARAKKLERTIEARREHARAVVAAGEAGVSGVTPELVERGILGEGGRDITTIEANRQKKIAQAEREKRAAVRRGTTVGLPPRIGIPGIDFLGPALQAGLSIGGIYVNKESKKKTE